METKDQTIQSLTQKKKELTERREKLMRPVQELDRELAALTLSIAVFLRDETPAEPSGFPLRRLRNLTQTQAVVEIAKYNGGSIKSLEIKPILIAAKLMKNSKNAAHMVNGVIARSEAFERVRRGEYRLKGALSLKGDGESEVVHSPVQ
jgi:hypothetical protein